MIWIVELLVDSLASFPLGALLSMMLAVQRYNGLAYVSGERQRAVSMKSNGEKPSYALDPLIVRGWELKANGIRLEELLAAYAQLQGGDMQALEWFTATNTMIGIAYTYGLHPNASAGRPYDGMWKLEYAGARSVIAAYQEEHGTRQISVGVLLHHRTR